MAELTPMEPIIYGGAWQMGRAIAMGYLPRAHAEAAIAVAACRLGEAEYLAETIRRATRIMDDRIDRERAGAGDASLRIAA